MSDPTERGESDIRKRAAWLLGMLALVAALLVVLMTTLLSGGSSSSGQTNDNNGLGVDDPTTSAAAPTGASSGGGSGPSTASGPASSTGASSTGASSTGPVPTPSCPAQATCTVTGDIAEATSAINAYRAQKGEKAVPASTSAAADKCALSDGNDCPSSFVWIRVKDLSGAAVVTGVTRFGSSQDLLDESAKSFEIGWAYDPASDSSFCAVIRND